MLAVSFVFIKNVLMLSTWPGGRSFSLLGERQPTKFWLGFAFSIVLTSSVCSEVWVPDIILTDIFHNLIYNNFHYWCN